MIIINTTSSKREVKVNTPDGLDFVHIQPKGRITLDSDHKVDANWKALHSSGLKFVEDTVIATAVAASAVASSITKTASSSDSSSTTTSTKE